jgi:hypothetical protein
MLPRRRSGLKVSQRTNAFHANVPNVFACDVIPF